MVQMRVNSLWSIHAQDLEYTFSKFTYGDEMEKNYFKSRRIAGKTSLANKITYTSVVQYESFLTWSDQLTHTSTYMWHTLTFLSWLRTEMRSEAVVIGL